MRKIALIAAMVLVSASAQAGQFRNLSPAGSDSRPVAAPLPAAPAPAPKIAEVPTPAPAEPVVSPAPPEPPAAAPEAGAPPVAASTTIEAPKYVERPTVRRAAAPAKIDETRHARRAERRHRGGNYWTVARIVGELHHYGIYW